LFLGTLAILFPLFLPHAPYHRALVFLPLFNGLVLIVLVLMSTAQAVHLGAAFLLSAGLTMARLLGLTWIPGKLSALLALAGGFLWARHLGLVRIPGKLSALAAVVGGFPMHRESAAIIGSEQSRLVSGICGLVLICAMIGIIPSTSRLWNPMIAPGPLIAAWREIQYWAKSHTPPDAKFLVPPLPEGFRAFSERTSWVDWRDGTAIYSVPEYAPEWRHRMDAIGIQMVVNQLNEDVMIRQYKEQSWERLSTVAREHNISYIIQYTEVQYPVRPVFTNERFAIYRVFN
jgi:hypothetical protein